MLSSTERGLELWPDEYENDDYTPGAVMLYGQEADNTDIDTQPNLSQEPYGTGCGIRRPFGPFSTGFWPSHVSWSIFIPR